MSNGPEDKSIKKSLFGWATGALNKVQKALEDAAPAESAPAPETPQAPSAPRPGSGTLGAAPRVAPRASQTGDLPALPGNRKSGALQLPDYRPAQRGANTGELQKPGSGRLAGDGLSLGNSAPPAPKPAATTGPLPTERSPEEEAAESKRRLALILAYMKNPEGDPSFKDKPLMYKILTEERSYQQAQILAMTRDLEQMPPPAHTMGLSEEAAAADPVYAGLEERRAALQKQINTAQTRQTQMFMLMKKLTGKTGKTGGTGFLASTEPPTP
jgi:hypothetical protein